MTRPRCPGQTNISTSVSKFLFHEESQPNHFCRLLDSEKLFCCFWVERVRAYVCLCASERDENKKGQECACQSALVWACVCVCVWERDRVRVRERERERVRVSERERLWKRQKEREKKIQRGREKQKKREIVRETGKEEKGFEIETESSSTNVPIHSFLNKICKAASTSEVLIFLKHSEEGRKTKTNSSLLLIEE